MEIIKEEAVTIGTRTNLASNVGKAALATIGMKNLIEFLESDLGKLTLDAFNNCASSEELGQLSTDEMRIALRLRTLKNILDE
jgi:hypothetical protein